MFTLACFKNIGANETSKCCERLICTLESEDKHIIVISKRNKSLPATIIKKYLNQTRQTLISSVTVKRSMCNVGLNG